jgi:hypothetical protein
MLQTFLAVVAGAMGIAYSFSPETRRFVGACWLYYRALFMICHGCTYNDIQSLCGVTSSNSSKLSNGDKVTKSQMTAKEELHLSRAVWLNTLAQNIMLWDKPHYRAASLRVDLDANFRNIAFPGTGFCMSWVVSCKPVAWFYLVFLHLWVVVVTSLIIMRSSVHRQSRTFCTIFETELLAPQHWFALWRINSTLVAAHHFAASQEVKKEYDMENKWTFLMASLEASPPVKVTPVITDMAEIVCKHKDIEGGMGINMFKNAVQGGDWILQERLYNCDEISALLPDDAPLSTFRVLTMIDPLVEDPEKRHFAATYVFRAGRAGKDTDHSSILFNVDMETLCIKDGKMFGNWYQVGRRSLSNFLSKQGISKHPDTDVEVRGKELKCGQEAVKICIDAHRRLVPNVPSVGWDVAVTNKHGSVLLEANLSCNFFGGSYDRQRYLRIVDSHYNTISKAQNEVN